MQNFLETERRNFNSMLKHSINSFLQAKKDNKIRCNCGNMSNFNVNIGKDTLTCKNCYMEIKLEEKAACV